MMRLFVFSRNPRSYDQKITQSSYRWITRRVSMYLSVETEGNVAWTWKCNLIKVIVDFYLSSEEQWYRELQTVLP